MKTLRQDLQALRKDLQFELDQLTSYCLQKSLLIIGADFMDTVSSEIRAKNMASIKSKNTSPEKLIRKFIHASGFRYRLHAANLPGKPDLVLRRFKLCIFVNGCFWHRHPRCKLSSVPSTRPEFWNKKFSSNITRDIKNRNMLLMKGWRVFDIWECGTKGVAPDLEWLKIAITEMDINYLTWPQT